MKIIHKYKESGKYVARSSNKGKKNIYLAKQ